MFIKNKALLKVISRTLHKNPEDLKKEDLLELVQLDASDLDADSLEGLQYAENLEKLNVANNALL
ncbi:MAG: Rab family protein, partial [Erysipelotrichaceae bacterium]|nr:Rab family protein [Erysipelotrichaceae bacterium]